MAAVMHLDDSLRPKGCARWLVMAMPYIRARQDVRKKAGSAITVDEGHGHDVNVASWNRLVNYLVPSPQLSTVLRAQFLPSPNFAGRRF